jgi:hypothetical protein
MTTLLMGLGQSEEERRQKALFDAIHQVDLIDLLAECRGMVQAEWSSVTRGKTTGDARQWNSAQRLINDAIRAVRMARGEGR